MSPNQGIWCNEACKPSKIMVAYISLGIGVAIGALLTYVCLIHPLLLSPLAKVPNAHWTSAFSPLWIQWTRYRHRELEAVLKAHRNLGPIVRLGPTDLSVNSYKDGIRIIYGGGFDKSSYFNHFNYYGSEEIDMRKME